MTSGNEIIEMTTKSGMSFTLSFSNAPPDFDILAKFCLLLADKPKNKSDDSKYKEI